MLVKIWTTVCFCLLFASQVNSSCDSEVNCQCNDIVFRKSECARAYLGRGCNFDYLNFRGKKEFFDHSTKTKYKNKISSIIVRPGCRLEIFEEEDFDGGSEVLRGINEDLGNSTVFNSYDCTCEEGIEPSRTPRKIRPISYPPTITIPNTHEEILALLNGTNEHVGLLRALESSKNKRSPKNAYILVIGLTGAGKSSTINALFDNQNITRVGRCGVNGIDEYRIPVPVDELRISNSELRIIDTPGFGDSRGLENDAKFLATLDDYLSGHEELSKYIPNVVLIFGKFNDNRFGGDGTSFVKMLRGIDLFRDRLTDKKYSNVVFVLSHYMSATKSLTRRPTVRLAEIKKTIEDFSLFPKPITIVVAENKALEEDQPMLNGYFALPNGDFYPKNLYDKIQQSTMSGSDPIGEAIIRTAFVNTDNFNITATYFSPVESKHAKVAEYLGILNTTNFKVNDTEVSGALATAFESLGSDLKSRFPNALPYLQRSFNNRNIQLKSNIPRTTVDIVKFLKEIPQNEANMFLMDKAFRLKMPELSENLVVGYGYSVIDDVTLPSTPFQFGPKAISDIGYLIPSVLTCNVENDIRTFYKIFENTAAYLDFRLQNLNVQGSVPVQSFKGSVKPGCNVIDLSNLTEAMDGHTVTAVREHRAYELVLNDRLDLNKEFVAAVKGLPTYNESDYEGLEVWKKFFARYGTHVVKSAHGGGSIEIQLKSMEPANPSISQAIRSIVQFAEDVSIGKISGLGLDTNGTQYTLKFKGGDFKYHATTLDNMSLSDAAQLLENWKESLVFSPVMLHSDIKLLSLSEVAKKIGHNISAEMERATLALLNSTLKYVPPTRPDRPPEPRENDKTFDSEADNQFTLNIQLLMAEAQKSFERFEKLMLEMEKPQEEIEIEEKPTPGMMEIIPSRYRGRSNGNRRLQLDKQRTQTQYDWEQQRISGELNQQKLNESEIAKQERPMTKQIIPDR